MRSTKKTIANPRTALTNRILDAATDITVGEVVAQPRLKRIPPHVRALFSEMLIEWAPNRAWGLSFKLGAPSVTVGHRRGDHIATYPWLHNLTPNDAERLLCAQIEGTLLHELGHAIFDLYLEAHNGYVLAAKAALTDGPPSSYRGQDVTTMAAEDLLHEMFAEAFRYWCHNDDTIKSMQPAWTQLVNAVVDYAENNCIT